MFAWVLRPELNLDSSNIQVKKVNVMPLKNESILAIGMISMSLGILIGRFLHFEYAGFQSQLLQKEFLLIVFGDESHLSNQNSKEVRVCKI